MSKGLQFMIFLFFCDVTRVLTNKKNKEGCELLIQFRSPDASLTGIIWLGKIMVTMPGIFPNENPKNGNELSGRVKKMGILPAGNWKSEN